NDLEKLTDRINLLEAQIDSLTSRNLTDKASQVEAERNSYISQRSSIETSLWNHITTLNTLILNTRDKLNDLTGDPAFSTGYTEKPAGILEYEYAIDLYYSLFENATEGFLGQDTFQLFHAANILSVEYQLLSDLIDDYNSGVIPSEDKNDAVLILASLAEQINEHAGAVEYISFKISAELEKLDAEILNDYK